MQFLRNNIYCKRFNATVYIRTYVYAYICNIITTTSLLCIYKHIIPCVHRSSRATGKYLQVSWEKYVICYPGKIMYTYAFDQTTIHVECM